MGQRGVSLELLFCQKLGKIPTQKNHTVTVSSAPSRLSSSLFFAHMDEFVQYAQKTLIITESIEATEEISKYIKQFQIFRDSPLDHHVLPCHDVSPYSGLYSAQKTSSQRVHWLYQASFSEAPGLYIAPIKALAQKTLPQDTLLENSHQFQLNEEFPDTYTNLLQKLGYRSVPLVEDPGSFSVRGGVVDIFSTAHSAPVRIELFGSQIESLRHFDPSTQKSTMTLNEFAIAPAHEILFTDDRIMRSCRQLEQKDSTEDLLSIQSQLRSQTYFEGIDFFLPYFYENCELPTDYFSQLPPVFWVDSVNTESSFVSELTSIQKEFSANKTHLPSTNQIYEKPKDLLSKLDSTNIKFDSLKIEGEESTDHIETLTRPIPAAAESTYSERFDSLLKKIPLWQKQHKSIFLFGPTETLYKKIKYQLERQDINLLLVSDNQEAQPIVHYVDQQKVTSNSLHYFQGSLPSSFEVGEDNVLFISLEHFLKKNERRRNKASTAISKAQALSFAELKEGDPVVHVLHGVAVYCGLKVMNIGGAEAEFLELQFKDKDKLFLPIYRLNQVHKFSGAADPTLDKLGGKQWGKTKAKVQKRLREIADELVRLYAARESSHRPIYDTEENSIVDFVNAFPYKDTEDQAQCYTDILDDFSKTKPMDRLICGDVGFGKTEMAMRAAFIAASQGKQVAILAPTTILTFQHFENFKKRFANWPIKIEVLNRFIGSKESKKIRESLKEGQVDIIIGTHRLLSQDIEFKNLGLLVVDEEQKFGVKHKEKIRKIKANVDTLAMSATPIPRTLNMSLLGIRDLSLINTAPHDRLPTRTFVCKFNMDVIKKAVDSEIKRGGQTFFLHNRVQSIYQLSDELRAAMPNVKMAVAHGQMDEKTLEKTIVDFFDKKIDMLICTTIIESGMDIPNANTMFVDQSNKLGLSQLYQLRGRVGRSKQRAFCYLLVPQQKKIDDVAKERLRILQQNTALGSGIQIAQYDLELRGAGTILGEEQSGTVDAVGYDLYMDLLKQAVEEAKGVDPTQNIEPEINLKIKALIPHKYMPDIRLRLSFYKALSNIDDEMDLDQIESDLRDQFGQPPEEVFNLMGLMLIRLICKKLGIRDVSAGQATLSLAFTETTPLSTEKVIELSMQANKKYSITPESRLKVRMKSPTWQNIYQELEYLLSKCSD